MTVYPISSKGNVAPLAPKMGLGGTQGVAVDKTGKMYVANSFTGPCGGGVENSVTIYESGSNGAVAPLATISGPNTGLTSQRMSIAVDSSGEVYVANAQSNSVTIYSAGSDGDAIPFDTISGPDTELRSPSAIALDSSGGIYVANTESRSISIYSPGSGGDARPILDISGNDTGLVDPVGIAVDSSGQIYVAQPADQKTGSPDEILVYARGSFGNAKPVAVISGLATQLDSPSDIAFDSKGKIYVTNSYGITVYNRGAENDTPPIDIIQGPHTRLSDPVSIALDSTDKIYAVNLGGDSLVAFGAGSTGDARPLIAITNPDTQIDGPSSIALDPNGKIYVANVGSAKKADYRIATYPPGSNADTAPNSSISGQNTELDTPTGVAANAGKFYVANQTGGSGIGIVTVYAAGSRGAARPVSSIGGPDTGIFLPLAIALGPGGKIYVSNRADTVVVFSSASRGDAKPLTSIEGPSTGLDVPDGVAVDQMGRIYVANLQGGPDAVGSVAIFSPASNGNAAPVATIAGPDTGLDGAVGIALDSQGNIYVANNKSNAITVYSPGSNGDARPIAVIGGSHTRAGPADRDRDRPLAPAQRAALTRQI